jgi:hypothetical protein
MQKWIRHCENPLRHSNYTEIITQIYASNNFLLDFEQMFQEKIIGEESFPKTFRLQRNNYIDAIIH